MQDTVIEELGDADFFIDVISAGGGEVTCETVSDATAFSTAVNAFADASAEAALRMCRGDIRDTPHPFEATASAIAEVRTCPLRFLAVSCTPLLLASCHVP